VASPVTRSGGMRNSDTRNMGFASDAVSLDGSHRMDGTGWNGGTRCSGTLALSVEFVAKPEKAVDARMVLPEAIQSALKEVDGFAGCVVLSSDMECRLVTVITYWTGSNNRRCCEQNLRWVKALVAKYEDRCLRVQMMLAHAPMQLSTPPPMQPLIPAEAPMETAMETTMEMMDEEAGFVMQECGEAAGNLCAA
jgi:hypothetical protein